MNSRIGTNARIVAHLRLFAKINKCAIRE
jgi:hypothetical protein